jgi:hypothetical protein
LDDDDDDDRHVVVVAVVVGVDDVSVVAHDVSVLEDVAAALDDGDGGHGVRRIRIAFEKSVFASRSDHSHCSPCGET